MDSFDLIKLHRFGLRFFTSPQQDKAYLVVSDLDINFAHGLPDTFNGMPIYGLLDKQLGQFFIARVDALAKQIKEDIFAVNPELKEDSINVKVIFRGYRGFIDLNNRLIKVTMVGNVVHQRIHIQLIDKYGFVYPAILQS